MRALVLAFSFLVLSSGASASADANLCSVEIDQSAEQSIGVVRSDGADLQSLDTSDTSLLEDTCSPAAQMACLITYGCPCDHLNVCRCG